MEKVWNMQHFHLDTRKTPEGIKRQLYSLLNKLRFSRSSFTWSSILCINQCVVCGFIVAIVPGGMYLIVSSANAIVRYSADWTELLRDIEELNVLHVIRRPHSKDGKTLPVLHICTSYADTIVVGLSQRVQDLVQDM